MIKRIVVALLVTVCIPVLGFAVSTGILAWHSEEPFLSSIFSPTAVELGCVLAKLAGDSGWVNDCTSADVYNLLLLKKASLWSGAIAIGLMALYIVLSLILGKNRRAISFIFPKLVPLSMLIIAGLVLVQGAILTYSAYVGEAYAIGQVHFILIGFVGLGAVIGSFALIGATLRIKKDLIQNEFASEILEADSPKLWGFVRDIADKVGAKVPDNIIVGLEPNFYATAAKVNLINKEKVLEGETLYLSTSLMRIFDKHELSSVVGHELGHFKGNDTVYSLKFAPVYAGLGESIGSLSVEEGEGISAIAKLPAIVMLSLMYELFSINERRISREREYEADKIGVSISTKEAMATALGKVAVYAPLWGGVRNSNIERLNERKVTRNLSSTFEDSARYDISHRTLEELMDEILQTQISHPTDTHPTIAERYRNIEFDAENLAVEDLIKVGRSSDDVMDGADSMEEDLTLVEHQLAVAVGWVTPPDDDDEDQTNYFLNAIYSIAAAMVGADGKIEQSEINIAEGIGQTMFDGFDNVEFREHCNNLEDIPKFRDIVKILGDSLKEEHKVTIYDYLKQIAMADDDLAEEEKELLVHLRKEWQLEI